jgi:hypothetical protein
MSVPAGSQPPDSTDSRGHGPRNTLTSTNLKAGPAPGSGRTPHGPRHSTPKAPHGTMPPVPRRSSTSDPGCRPAAGTSRHAAPAGAIPATRNGPPTFLLQTPVLSCRAANTHRPGPGMSKILLMRGVRDSAVTGARGPARGPQPRPPHTTRAATVTTGTPLGAGPPCTPGVPGTCLSCPGPGQVRATRYQPGRLMTFPHQSPRSSTHTAPLWRRTVPPWCQNPMASRSSRTVPRPGWGSALRMSRRLTALGCP